MSELDLSHLEEQSQRAFEPYSTNSFRKTYVCAKCDHHFKEGEGIVLGGIAYCRRYGCAAEEMDERRRRK